MASSPDNVNMAVFCDFENLALGVRDANYDKFDIKPVLERLLLKGNIIVKKAYCDWDRYKGFKAAMHEANFEMIEIPHVRQSGKNSADIRMVVDALDLCYTKSHVNTFVIISGDSDFSPLVSKLRENAKTVIAVGVKQSTSDLLVANCDEFIFYDDLVRERRRAEAKRESRQGQNPAQPAVQGQGQGGNKRAPDDGSRRKDDLDTRKTQAIDMAVETFDALVSERGDSGKIWASMLKEAIKRRKPDFSESYYGFRTFGNLLEEAQARGLLEFGRDEKSGAFVYRTSANAARAEQVSEAREQLAAAAPVADVDHDSAEVAVAVTAEAPVAVEAEPQSERKSSRRNGRGGRNKSNSQNGQNASSSPYRGIPVASDAIYDIENDVPEQVAQPVAAAEPALVTPAPVAAVSAPAAPSERRSSRGGRSRTDFRAAVPAPVEVELEAPVVEVQPEPEPVVVAEAAPVEVVAEAAPEAAPEARRGARGARKPVGKKAAAAAVVEAAVEVPAVVEVVEAAPVEATEAAPAKPARKPAARRPRAAKAKE
jgi:uncharacterized protein (TIGR00288 family)